MTVVEGRFRQYERWVVVAGLLLLLLGCYFVVRPFLTAFIWGAIISLSTRGLYRRVLGLVRGKAGLAATLTTLILVLVLLIPIAVLSAQVASGVPAVTARVSQVLESGVGPPPAWLAGVPLVGKVANARWEDAAAHPEAIRETLRPYLVPVRDFLIAAGGGLAVGILQFALALFMAGLLYVRGDRFAAAVDRVAIRLAGEFGHRQVVVVRTTIKSVFRGILGTCAVQAVLAMIGFLIAGVPNAVLLGMGTFFLSVVPGGPALLWLPAAIWLGVTGHTGWAIFVAAWGLLIVGGSDNIVRPLLIGKGVDAPLSLVFLGVVGGIVAFGFLGLFIGPTLLVVAYNLFEEWMESEKSAVAPPTAVHVAP
jgi:predicted PurR-regulated permease PerM